MGLALGALAGLLSGLQGVPKGMAEGTAADQRQQQIDEQVRHGQSIEDLQRQTLALHQSTADAPMRLDAVKAARAVTERKGSADAFRKAAIATNNPNLNTLADLIESGGVKEPGSIYETELKGQQGEADRSYNSDALNAFLTGRPIPARPQRGAPQPPMAAAVSPDIADAQRNLEATKQGVNRASDIYDATPGDVRGIIPRLSGGGGAELPSVPAGSSGPQAATAPSARPGYRLPTVSLDSKGSMHVTMNPETEHPVPYNFQAFGKGLQAKGIMPGTAKYDIAMANYAKLIPVGAGGATYGALDLTTADPTVQPAPGGGPTPPAPASPPGPQPLVQRPVMPTTAEVTQAADAQTWIKQAREAADTLESYFKTMSPAQRASYSARLSLQGIPIIGSMPGITSKQEQQITSSIGNLQLAWERASGGLRMASSPQMQDRIRKIFGDPANSATPEHLRTIAGQMEQEIQQRAVTEKQGGRPQIAVPPGGSPAAPPAARPAAPPAAPQGGTVSRRSAGYQKARQSGLSDQQIQQQFGVTLTD